MKFNKQRESRNFIDATAMDKLQKLMALHQAQDEETLNRKFEDQPPEGYGNWITNQLQNLSPDELHLMKNNGLSLQDVWILRQFKAGHAPPMDPTVPIYKR
jgi:hypothetical protein